ncbi:MAG: thioredoxin [Saprospiraceae bacterium]|nr:thioredoxin [Saprospiraceae bacterium]MDW8229576.1 thioredoxin [Saprospiraceae bacterium]
MVQTFTDDNFESEVLGSDKLTIVDLWAEWCGPCKMMNPVIEELAREYEGRAVIGKLDVDNNPKAPTEYNVRGIPTFLFFKNGQLVDRIVGARSKQDFVAKINAHLS